ncbi:MAG: multidrug efflux pump, partial [Paraglaciecola sp.]
MFLSDVAVKRPVFASVVNLLLVVFGIVSISLLS